VLVMADNGTTHVQTWPRGAIDGEVSALLHVRQGGHICTCSTFIVGFFLVERGDVTKCREYAKIIATAVVTCCSSLGDLISTFQSCRGWTSQAS
jgi:hypothetical protein